MPTVTVYCASSPQIPESFLKAGRELGRKLVEAGITPMCGGGATGLMGAVIDGAIAAGGAPVGVLPRFMVERGWDHPGLAKRIITEGMHPRKQTLLTKADAVIAMPGGIGTFEELLEAMTWRQLNLWHGRIAVLNLDGYYDPLLAQLNRAIEMKFMHPGHADLIEVATSVDQALAIVSRPDDHEPFSQKIRDKQ